MFELEIVIKSNPTLGLLGDLDCLWRTCIMMESPAIELRDKAIAFIHPSSEALQAFAQLLSKEEFTPSTRERVVNALAKAITKALEV